MKSYVYSKKFWFNALTILTVVATFFGYTPDQEIAEGASKTLLILSPFVNTILTLYFTKKPIVPVLPGNISSE
jgi:hypothetical protein